MAKKEEVKKVSYAEKLAYMNEHLKFDVLDEEYTGDNLFNLISLLAIATEAYRKGTGKSDILPFAIALKAIGSPELCDAHKGFLVKLSVLTDFFMVRTAKFDAQGCKDLDQVMAKIKTILDMWCPF